MKTDIEIIHVGMESFEEVLALLKQFFREPGFEGKGDIMRTSLGRMILDPQSAVFLAREEGKAIGVATVTTSVGVEYGRSAELEDLFVEPEKRGVGIAGELIESVCDWCAEEGIEILLVTVAVGGEGGDRLLRFYQGHEFEHTGRMIMKRTLGR